MIFCGTLMAIHIKKIVINYSTVNIIFQDGELLYVLDGFL